MEIISLNFSLKCRISNCSYKFALANKAIKMFSPIAIAIHRSLFDTLYIMIVRNILAPVPSVVCAGIVDFFDPLPMYVIIYWLLHRHINNLLQYTPMRYSIIDSGHYIDG